MKAFINDANGKIERLVADGEEAFEPSRPGTTLRDWPDGLNPTGLFWPAGEPAPIPNEVAALAAAKRDAAARIKVLREQHEYAGITTPYGPIDTDADSQRKIGGAVTTATILGNEFAINWRRADDEIEPLDAPKMIEVGLMVVAHISACQQRKNELDAAITSAADLAELAAIDITSGWPG